MNNNMSKQTETVLELLKAGQTITRTQATCLHDIANLSAVISDLRKEGNKIESIEIGGGFVKYELDDNAPFEREFFDFLVENDSLDSYIKNSIYASYGQFMLPDKPMMWVSCHFIWSYTNEGPDYWSALSCDWRKKLQTLMTR